MKIFRKIFVLVATSLGSLIGTSCASKAKPMYSNLHELENTAGGFLHYVDYDNYRDDTKLECINSEVIGGGCASIRCGNIYGRNLDYYYSNTVNFVVHVKGNAHRYESIGTARHAGFDKETIESIEKSGNFNKHIEYIPNLTGDGINEKGVVCNFNIVDFESYKYPTGTNPGKKKLHMYYICRYILDNAESADDAINLLNERNIYLPRGYPYNVHIMIADPNKTYIVEFINHMMVVKEKTGDNQIMTNFYNNLDDTDPSGLSNPNEHAMGIERYRWLRGRDEDYTYFDEKFDDYPESCKTFFTKWKDLNTVDNMMKALENIKFSRGYLTKDDPDGDKEFYPIWPSDDVSQTIVNNKELFELWKTQYFKYYCNEYIAVLEENRRDLGHEWEIWTTRHSVVYDIMNKTMRIVGEEDYANPTNFNLSGEVI